MKKLYIDVTQSYVWEGRVTGIIRVMDEISSRFIDDDRFDTVFIVWDEPRRRFCKVDYMQRLSQREQQQQITGLPTDVDENKEGFINLPLIRSTRKIAAKTPLIGYGYRTLRSFKDRTIIRLSRTPAQEVVIESDSLLFMPHGGVWESKEYAQRILGLQNKHRVKLIPIIYDFCPVLTPQFCSRGIRIIFSRYMKQTLAQSDLILAISKNTADDAKKWLTSLGHTPPRLKVFRLGDEIGGGESVKPKNNALPEKFIICVGTIEARKNHLSLYYTYKLAKQRGVDLPPVVIAGRKGWLAEEAYEIMSSDPEIKDKFIFLHGKSDQELAWLYEHSLFSIYPAFYEGWGLPVAESLLRGVPCLASNTSSLPEIAGELVGYFSPYSPEEILQKISSYTKDTSLRQSVKKKIQQQYKPTSWQDSYTQVASALLEV